MSRKLEHASAHMLPRRNRPRLSALAATAAVLLLAGCATTAVDSNFATARQLGQDKLGVQAQWLTTADEREQARTRVDALLAAPLSADDAVQVALSYSPAFQALLFEAANTSAGATQSARLPNPVFTFERLVRQEGGDRDLDIGRMISLPLFDVLMLPARQRMAAFQQEQARLKLAGDVVRTATEARKAWVKAVAAQQAVAYHEQVKTAADASAELARRMQSVGNFNRLQRAREQAFSAEAVAQLARARHAAHAAREALVRTLGLDETQALALKLPERLPDLPAQVRSEETVAQAALDERLDIRMARASLEHTARVRGITQVSSVVNGLHLGVVRNSETGKAAQKGYELELPLPIFDFGDASRTQAQSAYMAALQRTAQLAVDATSQVRETYVGYRTAYDLARHYRDEIVPLRKIISEENVLRYNGMLIGVFELLADAREQVASVNQALEAQRDFWIADAALTAALIGSPTAGLVLAARPAAAARAPAGH